MKENPLAYMAVTLFLVLTIMVGGYALGWINGFADGIEKCPYAYVVIEKTDEVK